MMNPTTAELSQTGNNSAMSTPGDEFPGAFPRGHANASPSQSTFGELPQKTSNTASSMGKSLYETVSQYIRRCRA